METADEGSEDEASDRLDDEDEPGRSGGREQGRSEFIDADAPAPAPQKSANQKESGSSGRDNTAVQKDSGSALRAHCTMWLHTVTSQDTIRMAVSKVHKLCRK